MIKLSRKTTSPEMSTDSKENVAANNNGGENNRVDQQRGVGKNEGPSEDNTKSSRSRFSFGRKRQEKIRTDTKLILDMGWAEDTTTDSKKAEQEDTYLLLMESGLFGSKEFSGDILLKASEKKKTQSQPVDMSAIDEDSFLWSACGTAAAS